MRAAGTIKFMWHLFTQAALIGPGFNKVQFVWPTFAILRTFLLFRQAQNLTDSVKINPDRDPSVESASNTINTQSDFQMTTAVFYVANK